MQGIYAIVDRKADMIVGGLNLHRHDASAVRWFGDVASQQDTIVNKHPGDFDLVRLGHVEETGKLDPETEPVVILTGNAWAAAQRGPE